ncbi:MAG: hypothetical protein ACXWZ4_15035 [Gemmatirosa sp.]
MLVGVVVLQPPLVGVGMGVDAVRVAVLVVVLDVLVVVHAMGV